MIRLFVALELPQAARDALAAVGAAADPGVWRAVAPESLHVTLAFLGARPESDVPIVAAAIAGEAGAPALRLRLARVLLLPPRRARVLTVELDHADALLALQSRLARRLVDAGVYEPEARAFRPHVTVARLRPRVRSPHAAAPPFDPLEFSATAITLFRSHLHPGGARYEPLARAGFG